MHGVSESTSSGDRGIRVDQANQVEARRQLANSQWSYDSTLENRDENLALAVEEAAPERLLFILRTSAISLLMLGQGQHMLDRDSRQARRTFAQLGEWLALLDACNEGVERKPLGLSLDLMLEPAACALLSGDDRTIRRIGSAHENIFRDPKKEAKGDQARCQMVRDVLAMMRDGRQIQPGKPPAPHPDDLFAPYAALLPPIVANRADTFESERAKLEAQYPLRGKRRDKGLNWYGAGALSQSFTCDALGAALCHLAVRCGVAVDTDTKLYPRAFITGQGTLPGLSG